MRGITIAVAAAAATAVTGAVPVLPGTSGAWASATGPVRPAEPATATRGTATGGHRTSAGRHGTASGTHRATANGPAVDASDMAAAGTAARRPPRGPAHGKSRGAAEVKGGGKRFHLMLTYKRPGDPAAKRAVVTCEPPQGDHPKLRQACRDLTAAGGDLNALGRDSQGRVCTMLYAPVTVRAIGYWNGMPVRWTHTFPNDCLLKQKTASVFSY